MTERDIEDYFATIGVGHPKSEAVFIRKGRKRFGDTFDKVMSVIVQRGAGNKVNPYDLKNASLDLSLYVGEHYASETWRALAQWFVREQLPAPERVLDLGCENGVVSCLLATLWPQSQILGLDRSGHAISAARELAARLGRKNVTFEQSNDARQFLARNPNTFSMIVASLVMDELLESPNARKRFHWNEPYGELEDIRLSQMDEYAISMLKQLRIVRRLKGSTDSVHYLERDEVNGPKLLQRQRQANGIKGASSLSMSEVSPSAVWASDA
jgi:hypothetical protein